MRQFRQPPRTPATFVAELNSEERETLYNRLMQRELHDARAKAIQVADLLASYLQFLGRVSPSLANDAVEVRAIIKRLGDDNG